MGRKSKIDKLSDALNIINQIKINKQILKGQYSKKIENRLNDACYSAIYEYYDDYDPVYYRRKESLYDVYKVNVKGSSFNVEINESLIKKQHNVSNNYIYDIMFKEGWHGGAMNTVNQNGGAPFDQPYYRKPFLVYSEWGYPAIKSESPYNKLIEYCNDAIKSLQDELNEDYDNKVTSLINNLEDVVKDII